MRDEKISLLKKNKLLMIVAALFPSFTVFFFGPMEIFLSESIEFWFGVKDVISIMILSFLVAFSLVLLILSLSILPGERFFCLFCGIVISLGFCFYIQGNWVFVNYGIMDGSPINWNDFRLWGIINWLIWIVIGALFVLLILKNKNGKKMLQSLALGILLIEMISLLVLFVSSVGKTKESGFSIVGGDEFALSSDKDNIIVVLADGFDGMDLLPVFREEPALKDYFDGFVFYEDAAGTSLWSEESGITLLTGNQFEVGPSFKENVENAYENTDLYDVLEENNYKTYLFLNKGKMVSDVVLDKVENFILQKTEIGKKSDAFKLIYKMVLFRYVPHDLKKYFWYSTMDFDSLKSLPEQTNRNPFYRNYDLYDYLKQNGVQVKNTGENIYQFFWIQGPHEPANTDRYCQKITDVYKMDNPDYKNKQFEQTIGVVRLFSEIISQLKEQGIYDNTTIIFTADHGWDIRPNPLFLVKKQNSHGPLEISDVPVSVLEDYLPTLKYLINPRYGVESTIYSLKDGQERERPIYVYSVNKDRTYNSRKTVYYKNGEFVLNQNLVYDKVLKPNNIVSVARKGLSSSEKSHVWTDGNEALLSFVLQERCNARVTMEYQVFDGPQRVRVYANDTLVDEFVEKGSALTRTFEIPESCFSSENLDLKFVLPDAHSPASLNNGNKDKRILGLGFKSIVIRKSGYDIGSEMFFTNSRPDFRNYENFGFSNPETQGTWSLGHSAELKIKLNNYRQTDLTMTLDYRVYRGFQSVKVFAGDVLIDEYTAEGSEKKSLEIPALAVVNDELHLRFEFPDATSPKDNGESADSRVLALYFRSLKLEEC